MHTSKPSEINMIGSLAFPLGKGEVESSILSNSTIKNQ